MNHFRIGGKVVCIHPGPWHELFGRNPAAPQNPVIDQTYTVSGFRDFDLYGPGLILEELGHDGTGRPWSYDAKCFRQLIERSTDISALTELLNPLNHKPLPEVIPVKAPARV